MKHTDYKSAQAGFDVQYNSKGINHIAHDTLAGERTYLKNQIIPFIDKYLEKNKCIAWELNKKKDKKPTVWQYHYFEVKLPDGKFAYVAVEESIFGKVTLYSITDKLRKNGQFLRSTA
jgi:hypothetical protein